MQQLNTTIFFFPLNVTKYKMFVGALNWIINILIWHFNFCCIKLAKLHKKVKWWIECSNLYINILNALNMLIWSKCANLSKDVCWCTECNKLQQIYIVYLNKIDTIFVKIRHPRNNILLHGMQQLNANQSFLLHRMQQITECIKCITECWCIKWNN